MKKHISQIDLIRAICCIGVAIYHFGCHTNSKLSVLSKGINTNIGSAFVTVFFIVSGFVLYQNYKKIDSLKEYYTKRFKAVFPSFYLCWFIFYVINVIKVKTPFYAGNPIKFLLTLIGQDGYFSQRIVTYYTVGEWFLGAIIIVYCLYPLLLKLFNKNDKLTLTILFLLTLCVHFFNIPVISPGFPGIIESCLKFYLGMILNKYNLLISDKKIVIVSFAYFLFYTFVKVSVLNVLFDILYGICLFILLFNLGSIINNRVVKSISDISYQIFLLQHMIITYVLEFSNPVSISSSFILLIISIALTIILALIIKKLTKIIMNRLFYKNA